ncbi:MAG: T9SS type A sorting domain-containing protein [Saprospiraceae bacterium]
MSKIKLVLTIFLAFGIFTTNLQASELARLCGIKTPSVSSSPVCNEESGIIFKGGPGCSNQIVMSIYFANLIGFDVEPMLGESYDLPTTMPDLYVQLDVDFDGNYEVTIPIINGFIYNGDFLESPSLQGFHYIYQHEIDITQYFSNFNPCPDSDEKTISARVIESKTGPVIFDPIPYGDVYGVASCEVFHETCSLCLDGQGNPIASNCDGDSSVPQYDFDICVDCTSSCKTNRVILSNNQFEEIKLTPSIAPNPFTDEVAITFETQKGDTPTEIEIYDWTGALVMKKSVAPEIGMRKVTLDMGSLPQGIYYLNLLVDESRTTSKIIKL